MSRVFPVIAAVLSSSSLLLIDTTIKGVLILFSAAFAALLLRRDSAATRHLVWLVAVIALLVVPLFSVLLPQWNVLPEWAAISGGAVDEELAAAKPSGDFVVNSEDRNAVAFPMAADFGDESIATDFPSVADMPRPRATFVSGDAVAVVDAETASASPAPVRNWINALPMLWLVGFGVLVLRLTAARLMLGSIERRGTTIAS